MTVQVCHRNAAPPCTKLWQRITAVWLAENGCTHVATDVLSDGEVTLILAKGGC
jgi:hypothetical protein